MTAAEIFAIVCSVLAALSAIVAVITFFINRSKARYDEGSSDGGLRGDVKYMRNTLDDVRLDLKEISRKQDAQSERLARVEESAKQAHKRIDTIEHKINSAEE